MPIPSLLLNVHLLSVRSTTLGARQQRRITVHMFVVDGSRTTLDVRMQRRIVTVLLFVDEAVMVFWNVTDTGLWNETSATW